MLRRAIGSASRVGVSGSRTMGGSTGPAVGGEGSSPLMQKYMQTEPQLFNEKPSAGGRKWQHWEGSFYFLVAGTIFLMWVGQDAPNTSMTDWARDEAEERNRRREEGKDVQYGMNYAMLKAMGKDADADEEEE